MTWAHPRPCGEHSLLQMRSLLHLGSSPPVRGAQHVHIPEPAPRGLIPARAGSTVGCTGGRVCRWAHPRPCGEHAEWLGKVLGPAGSSPPVRGAPRRCAAVVPCGGLIPARAGSTPAPVPAGAIRGAHPRPCGEHLGCKVLRGSSLGSSPPVRGARVPRHGASVKIGLIPARAGSTVVAETPSASARAHPRPCGEHALTGQEITGVEGSSPPVRGALKQGVQRLGGNGLIPARAGSTTLFVRWLFPIRAHPRPCGEHG